MADAKWTGEWVRDRVKQGHHQALTKYLMHRDKEMERREDAEGLTADEIVRRAFRVDNGHTAVPQAAIKLHRAGLTSYEVTLGVCRESRDLRVLAELMSVIERYATCRGDLVEQRLKEIRDIITVRQVMES